MTLSIIVAVAANGVIGLDNQLPWHLSADLRRFKRLTMGHHLIVGRRTFEAIGRPLPGRRIVVLTRNREFSGGTGAQLVVHSLAEGLAAAAADNEVFVAGGEEIYRQALPLVDRLHITRVRAEFEGDAYFPQFDEEAWQVKSCEDHRPDEKNPYAYSFVVYERPPDARTPQTPR